MARYKVVRGFCFETGKDVYPGDVVEITNKLRAEQLLKRGSIAEITGADDAPVASEESGSGPEGEAATETRRRRA
jgi:hypothetical protein